VFPCSGVGTRTPTSVALARVASLHQGENKGKQERKQERCRVAKIRCSLSHGRPQCRAHPKTTTSSCVRREDGPTVYRNSPVMARQAAQTPFAQLAHFPHRLCDNLGVWRVRPERMQTDTGRVHREGPVVVGRPTQSPRCVEEGHGLWREVARRRGSSASSQVLPEVREGSRWFTLRLR
jgi:hypothetical protein